MFCYTNITSIYFCKKSIQRPFELCPNSFLLTQLYPFTLDGLRSVRAGDTDHLLPVPGSLHNTQPPGH